MAKRTRKQNKERIKSFEQLIEEYLSAGGEYTENIGKTADVMGNYIPPANLTGVGPYGKINVSPYSEIFKDDKYGTVFHELMHMLDDKSSEDLVEIPKSNEERAAELDIPLDAFLMAQEQNPNHPLWGNQLKTVNFGSDSLKNLAKKQGKPLEKLLEDVGFLRNLNPKRTKYVSHPSEFTSFVTEGSDISFYDDLEESLDPFRKKNIEGEEKSIHDLIRLVENVNTAFDIGKSNIESGKDIFSSKSINFLNSYLENTRNKYLAMGSTQEAKPSTERSMQDLIKEFKKKNEKQVMTSFGPYKRYVPPKNVDKRIFSNLDIEMFE
jgi:hypothetical protein